MKIPTGAVNKIKVANFIYDFQGLLLNTAGDVLALKSHGIVQQDI